MRTFHVSICLSDKREIPMVRTLVSIHLGTEVACCCLPLQNLHFSRGETPRSSTLKYSRIVLSASKETQGNDGDWEWAGEWGTWNHRDRGLTPGGVAGDLFAMFLSLKHTKIYTPARKIKVSSLTSLLIECSNWNAACRPWILFFYLKVLTISSYT